MAMNKLSLEKQVEVVAALVEGRSFREITRMMGVRRATIINLLVNLGRDCADYQDEVLRDLPCTRIQCDEICQSCYAKRCNLPDELKGKQGYGDVWMWTAICADTKLVPCWLVGTHAAETAYEFIHDLKSRLATRVQLTTDGHRACLTAVEDASGCDDDYATLAKLYGAPRGTEAYCTSARCIGRIARAVARKSDPAYAPTRLAERKKLRMRSCTGRFTRLTIAHSKKVADHQAAIALHFMHYNFCRIHQTLRCTPTMEAGITDHVWDLEEMLGRTTSVFV
jgi:IS1 family transposase